jgi:ribosomal protein L16/L10AE
MKFMRANGGKLWRRLSTPIPVCIKGNETRMGKGKGAFDHWMARVPTGKVLFECGGENLHEQVAREAMKRAADKLPGLYEFIKVDTPVRVGLKTFRETEEKINYFEELEKKPSKVYLNKLKSKEDVYRLYRGR